MKKNFLFAAAAVVLFNCQNPKAENPPPAPTEIDVAGEVAVQKPTATNSIKYLGVYKGMLPCADCAGIETSLELAEDFTFKMVSKQHGKSVETLGTFRWGSDGKSIRLDNEKAPYREFLVADGTLSLPNTSSQNTDAKYVLRKIPAAAVAELPVPAKNQAGNIVGVRWKLVELNGHAVKIPGDKPLYIQLDAMNAFTGFAGCNNLRGHYETRENRIRFMRIMGTMKGCDQLHVEEKIKAMLGMANNFVIEGKVLQFRDKETVLAKFEAI